MADIINLNRHRKRAKKKSEQEKAERNRIRHGRTKQDKQTDREQRRRADARLDGKRRVDGEGSEGSEDGEDGEVVRATMATMADDTSHDQGRIRASRQVLVSLMVFAGCGECDVSVGEVTVGGQKVHEDLSVPRTFNLDPSYAREHGYDIPAKIRFESPRRTLQEHTPPKEEGIFLRLEYFDEAGRPSEDFLITSFNVASGSSEYMAAVEAAVHNDALPAAMSGEGEIIGTRDLQISGMPAIAGAGKVEHKELGTVFTAVFAIPLPRSERGIAIVSHHIAQRCAVKTPKDIGKKGVLATVLASMTIEVL